MLNINLFGGPGTGKSTIAAGIFSAMKHSHKKAELLQEFAKDLTYGKDGVKLSDQLYILGKQHHKLFRLRDQVDYVIHDSPFVMGVTYINKNDPYVDSELFKALALDMYSKYNNMNVFLTRTDEHPYQAYGRSQTLDEASVKDIEIKQFLVDNAIPFVEVPVGTNTVAEVISLIKE